MIRWEYSSFSFGRSGNNNFSQWVGPDGARQDMSGPTTVILTTLGHDGWEVISVLPADNTASLVWSTSYLLKRALG
jgi:hypothetical protein